MDLRGLDVPVIANVYVLSPAAARYFHNGTIPGCVVTSDLLDLVERQAASPDKGKGFFQEFAAKQVAIARGLGYRGAYLGGHLGFEDYRRIMEIEDSFAPDDWRRFAREISYHQPGEFYYFERDAETGLTTPQVNPAYVASKEKAGLREARAGVPLSYRANRVVHDRIFERASLGFKLGAQVYKRIENAGGKLKALAHAAEHALKWAAFDCRDCGDCSLPDIAYLCPESQCAKNQRNGPCGGTRQGQCEVGEKECIWALAYDRLKAYGEEETMLDGPAVFRNGSLRGTSAWANTFLGRDHRTEKLVTKPG